MSDTAQIKRELEYRLATLSTRVEELEGELRSPHSSNSQERAVEMEGSEVQERLKASALSEIAQIQAALRRIEAGSYGECVTCGEAIGEKRLKALPYATNCINCAGGRSP